MVDFSNFVPTFLESVLLVPSVQGGKLNVAIRELSRQGSGKEILVYIVVVDSEFKLIPSLIGPIQRKARVPDRIRKSTPGIPLTPENADLIKLKRERLQVIQQCLASIFDTHVVDVASAVSVEGLPTGQTAPDNQAFGAGIIWPITENTQNWSQPMEDSHNDFVENVFQDEDVNMDLKDGRALSQEEAEENVKEGLVAEQIVEEKETYIKTECSKLKHEEDFDAGSLIDLSSFSSIGTGYTETAFSCFGLREVQKISDKTCTDGKCRTKEDAKNEILEVMLKTIKKMGLTSLEDKQFYMDHIRFLELSIKKYQNLL
eukprot:CAMPEP_0184653230 /NCGR_PEP_ID=MMETSP0308-20130426/10966_1 /TAXON_ID=38269 /ORGANISM="Gloeochaete witrockiana, Strain SAG 46.84" /LENGTH=315 /DNA_ID=CAMNT_0027088591 /DNA_START=327 /DNA_END=1274 /DNA_ORIENTATION=+